MRDKKKRLGRSAAAENDGEKKNVWTPEEVRKRYNKGVEFKTQLGLYDTVTKNENFYIGKQWEGVQSNGLPTPVFNFLKRVVMFDVASITSDNIKVQISAALCAKDKTKAEMDRIAKIVNAEVDQIMERNNVTALLREYARNAAVDGDGCLYTYYDPDVETGQDVKGEIKTEIVENTRVHFGNPNDRHVQSQPYIIISRRLPVEDVKWLAEENGIDEDDIDNIKPDNDAYDSYMDTLNDDRVTLLTCFWRDRQTRHIWKIECTDKVQISEPEDMELMLYPLTWLCWDYIQDSMHGQAMVTGLLPNQMFVNRLFAMTMLSLMTTAYPKVIYDKTRISSWDSRVGAAIAVNGGGDMSTIARIMDPAQISPQISQFIDSVIEYTQSFLGASDVAMGDARPDNTSAIIALQRAANTPLELTKQNLYQSDEDLSLIYIDFMRVYYGKRMVEQIGIEGAADNPEQPFGVDEALTARFLVEFDFEEELKTVPFRCRVDVGASSYWSEIASMQTLDNLLMQGKIDTVDYLERVPAGIISNKEELIDKLKKAQMAAMMPTEANTGGGNPYTDVLEHGMSGEIDTADSLPVVPGGGNGSLQRAIVADEGGLKY